MILKLTFNYLATALVDIPAVSMPTARSLKRSNIYGIVLFDKTAHFKVAFYCTQHKVQLCSDHAVLVSDQLLDIPHLSGRWIILAKEKCSLTRI
jgi:hypothetical protein